MNRSRWMAVALITLIAVINLYSLEQYPMPHADEAIYADIGYGFYERGTFSTEIFGAQYGLDYNHINSGRVYHLIEGAALRLHRSLFIARLISYLGWLVGILACFLAGRALYDDERVGLISAVAFAASMRALFSSHFARPEIWVAAWAVISLWVMVITLKHPTLRRLFVLGLIAVPGLAFHPMGVWFAGAVGLIVLIETVRARQWRNLAMFLLGCGIATGVFVLLHLMPDPARTLRYLTDSSWFVERMPLSGSLGTRLANLSDFLSSAYVYHLNYSVAPFTLWFVASVAVLAIRRRWEDRVLLAFMFASLIAFLIGLQYRSPYYGVLWDGVMAVCIGAAVTHVAKRFSRVGVRHFSVGAQHASMPSIAAPLQKNAAPSSLIAWAGVLPLILIAAAAWGYLSLKFHPRDFDSYSAALREHIPPDARVMADTSLWWAFADRVDSQGRNAYISDWQFYDWQEIDQITPGETVERYDIEYVVDDQTTVADDSGSSAAEALSAYLSETCEVIATIEDRWFARSGQIGSGVPTVIYRCTP